MKEKEKYRVKKEELVEVISQGVEIGTTKALYKITKVILWGITLGLMLLYIVRCLI